MYGSVYSLCFSFHHVLLERPSFLSVSTYDESYLGRADMVCTQIPLERTCDSFFIPIRTRGLTLHCQCASQVFSGSVRSPRT